MERNEKGQFIKRGVGYTANPDLNQIYADQLRRVNLRNWLYLIIGSSLVGYLLGKLLVIIF